MNIAIKKVSLKSNKGILGWLEQHPETQVVCALAVASRRHAEHAVMETLKAFAQGRNISRKPELEFLIRLTGERQLSKAFVKSEAKGDKAVFISWSEKNPWPSFKEKFVKRESEFEKTEDLDAIEKTSTFWLWS